MSAKRRSTQFVFLPGAGTDPWYWHQVRARLEVDGHRTVAVDLPCDDDTAGLDRYAEAALEQIGDISDPPILVAHSFGAFTAPWSVSASTSSG